MFNKSLFDRQTEFAVRQYAKGEGRAEGQVEGRAEGQVEATDKVIRNLLKAGDLSISKIAECTGWSKAEIKKIKDSIERKSLTHPNVQRKLI